MNRTVVKGVVLCGLAAGAVLCGWACAEKPAADQPVVATAAERPSSNASSVNPAARQPNPADPERSQAATARNARSQAAKSAREDIDAKEAPSRSPANTLSPAKQSATANKKPAPGAEAIAKASVAQKTDAPTAAKNVARIAPETAQPGQHRDDAADAKGDKLTLEDAQRTWRQFSEDAANHYQFTEDQRKDAQRILESCLTRAAMAKKQPDGNPGDAQKAAEPGDRLRRLDDELIGRIDALASLKQIQDAAAKGFKSPKYREPPVPPDVGRPAPDFQLTDGSGKPVKLASLRGKVVVLQFWATWCGFCKKAMPEIQKLQETFKDDPSVVIYGINCAQRPNNPKPEDVLKEQKYTYGLLLNGDGVAELYDVHGYPALFVVGPDGKIVEKQSGAQPDQAAKLTTIIQKAAGKPVTAPPAASPSPPTASK